MTISYRCDKCFKYFWHQPIKVLPRPPRLYACSKACAKSLASLNERAGSRMDTRAGAGAGSVLGGRGSR